MFIGDFIDVRGFNGLLVYEGKGIVIIKYKFYRLIKFI